MKPIEILQNETDGLEEQSRLRYDVLDAMEQYANQKVIEELENIAKEIGIPIANRIKELKQNE
tara:strand:+ start:149 stop:337 length:189 start_codon:yes stop_codon:yes gene_type:complete